MKPILIFLISQSVLLPLIIGLVRLRRLGKRYQPFLILLFIGFLTEVVSFIMIQVFRGWNAVSVNIYVLIEWLFIAWQFHVWGFLKQKNRTFYGLLIFTSLLWIAENFIFGKITVVVPYFRFLYFFLIVLFSVNEINFMLTHDNRNFFRNPKFLICIGFIIYFIFMIVYFWAFQVSRVGTSQPSNTSEITSGIIFLMAYVNAFTNIIYAIAFLLIPAPVKFTLK
jgi:hypothetical protein